MRVKQSRPMDSHTPWFTASLSAVRYIISSHQYPVQAREERQQLRDVGPGRGTCVDHRGGSTRCRSCGGGIGVGGGGGGRGSISCRVRGRFAAAGITAVEREKLDLGEQQLRPENFVSEMTGCIQTYEAITAAAPRQTLVGSARRVSDDTEHDTQELNCELRDNSTAGGRVHLPLTPVEDRFWFVGPAAVR